MFPRRLHRLAYFLREVALGIVAGILYANITTYGPRYWWPWVVALFIYEVFFIVLPRIRDAGMNAWWLAVAFIPIPNIVLGILLLFRAPAFLADGSPNEGTAPNGGPATALGNSGVTEGPPSVS